MNNRNVILAVFWSLSLLASFLIGQRLSKNDTQNNATAAPTKSQLQQSHLMNSGEQGYSRNSARSRLAAAPFIRRSESVV